MIGQSIGKYEIRSEIGRGGMATVYLAHDPTFRRQVAVKVLPPQYLENNLLRARFEREARTIATIEHPAIVPVYDFGEQDGQLYLVMRYMPGGALARRIQRSPFPLETAIDLIARITPALDAVHARGIVHRDLKPANILFDGFGNPALSDFGIAHLTETTLSLTGDAILGTPFYMSPEQVRGEPDIDGRSDVYALGVIFYEMLSGRQPYQASTPMSVAMKHLTDPVPQLLSLHPHFPREVDAILLKAMAKNRQERYARASDLVADLRAIPEPSHSSPAATLKDEPLTLQQASSGSPAPASSYQRQASASLPRASKPAAAVDARAKTAVRKWILPLGAGGLFSLAGLCVLLAGAIFVFRGSLFPAPPATSSPTDLPVAISVATATPTTALPSPTDTAPTPVPASPTPEAEPGDTPGPASRGGEILLTDDFSSPQNGWPMGSSYTYQDGVYRISADRADTLFWASPVGGFTDTSLSVEATWVSGGPQSYFGLLCRIADPNNFYYLIVRGDGYFTIGKYKNAEYNALMPGGWTVSAALSEAHPTYSLRADCIADRLSLYLDDVLLGEVRDGDFASGGVGLAAAADVSKQGLEIDFDNFNLYQPD